MVARQFHWRVASAAGILVPEARLKLASVVGRFSSVPSGTQFLPPKFTC
jgi:hypothetical protein